jgi:hypothetical protein
MSTTQAMDELAKEEKDKLDNVAEDAGICPCEEEEEDVPPPAEPAALNSLARFSIKRQRVGSQAASGSSSSSSVVPGFLGSGNRVETKILSLMAGSASAKAPKSSRLRVFSSKVTGGR